MAGMRCTVTSGGPPCGRVWRIGKSLTGFDRAILSGAVSWLQTAFGTIRTTGSDNRLSWRALKAPCRRPLDLASQTDACRRQWTPLCYALFCCRLILSSRPTAPLPAAGTPFRAYGVPRDLWKTAADTPRMRFSTINSLPSQGTSRSVSWKSSCYSRPNKARMRAELDGG